MIVSGTLITQLGKGDKPLWPQPLSWNMSLAGALLALYVFMRDAIHAPDWTRETLAVILPVAFNWSLFLLALALMSAPIANMCWQIKSRVTTKT